MAIAFQVVVNSSAVPDISSLISGGRPAFFKGRITFSSTTFIASSSAILSAGLIWSVTALSPSICLIWVGPVVYTIFDKEETGIIFPLVVTIGIFSIPWV